MSSLYSRKKKSKSPQVSRQDCFNILKSIDSKASLRAELVKAREAARKRSTDPSAWVDEFDKLILFIDDPAHWPIHPIFTPGNSKLPFHSFSVAPVVTCPGAGECLSFCYSYKAFRYPAAFGRMVQNTFLMEHSRLMVSHAFRSLPAGTLRLYVDGDFKDLNTLKYWLRKLRRRPDIQAYGYSKSLDLFLEYDAAGYTWPDNYKLNISSGSRFDGTDVIRQVERLPVSRGRFIAVPVQTAQRTDQKQYAREVRAAAGPGRVFVCPGKCGSCTSAGHACGSDTFQDYNIAIDIH